MRIRRSGLAAGLWGLAEATIFFIVPDVLLSWVALKHPRKALLACLWALVGALAGGALIWYFGRSNPDAVRALFVTLPAIDADMLANVRAQLNSQGLFALFIGPLIGTPYKLYALEAASVGFGILLFLLVSIPARLLRFILVVGLFVALSHVLRRHVSLVRLRALHVAGWTGFYAWYFHVMSSAA